MRYTRQNKIVELIAAEAIDTQERLAERLKDSGYDVTQATVSRDIKELQLVKTMTPDGKYRYALPDAAGGQQSERFVRIFQNTVTTVVSAGNMVVVKTLPGCANAACEAIDSLNFPDIVGSLAGDNTAFLVCDDAERANSIVARFEALLEE